MSYGIGYNETQNNLNIRIEAHKNFSSFSLEDWLDANLQAREGDHILDIGCGNGNLFPVYLKKLAGRGSITGLDKSKELLLQAQKKVVGIASALLQWDMNIRMPFLENTFDYALSTFAIYYVDDPGAIISNIKEVLKPGGEMFLIGPTENNAKELYEFNDRIFGSCQNMNKIAAARTSRLEQEFYPAAEKTFGFAKRYTIPSRLTFPRKSDFLRYYTATLLFEESCKKAGFVPDPGKINAADLASCEISKEMVVIYGEKDK